MKRSMYMADFLIHFAPLFRSLCSQRPSRPVFPTFDGDTTANEVTLLTNVARESTESPTVGATETAVINQSRMVLSNVRNPKLMNTQPVTTILSPIPPPRPYNVPRISQPVSLVS